MFRIRSFVLAAALLAPKLAFGLGTLEGFYGIARSPGTSFHSDVSGAVNDPHLFKDSLQNAGGDLMFNLSWFQFGAIVDTTWASHSASQMAVGGLAGLKIPLGIVRLDLMGEAGGHRYGHLGSAVNSNKDEWLAYVGLRPGIAFKFAAPDQPGLIIGVWTFARWDLNSNRVPVTGGNAGNVSAGSLKLGGSTIGATLRLGFDF
ncbi:MAG TPA: hypothetical protein VFG59_12780 [Anaeromyxobacter sp.]|nr:hypothetical protein [Anaeromyxobacter sp.]